MNKEVNILTRIQKFAHTNQDNELQGNEQWKHKMFNGSGTQFMTVKVYFESCLIETYAFQQFAHLF